MIFSSHTFELFEYLRSSLEVSWSTKTFTLSSSSIPSRQNQASIKLNCQSSVSKRAKKAKNVWALAELALSFEGSSSPAMYPRSEKSCKRKKNNAMAWHVLLFFSEIVFTCGKASRSGQGKCYSSGCWIGGDYFCHHRSCTFL